MNGLGHRIKALEWAVGGVLARDRWLKLGRALSRGMVRFGGAGIASGKDAECTGNDGRKIGKKHRETGVSP